MTNKEDTPRWLITKVRKKVHKPTIAHIPKTVYDRNEWKRETEKMIDEECTCKGKVCTCKEDI